MKQSKNIWFLIAVVAVITQVLIHFPDFFRFKNTPSDKWFTGQVSWFDPWDHNVYFSAIGWGKRDGLLFINLYDTESTQAMPLYPLYTLIGKLAGFLSLSNALAFHLSAVLLSIFLIIFLWRFLPLFFKKDLQRKTAFIIILLGGGLGWIFFPYLILPDLGQPGFTLESALRRPHEAISLSLFLLILGSVLTWRKNQNKNLSLFLIVVSSFFLFLFHPYTFLTLGVLLTVYSLYFFIKTEKFAFLKPLFFLGLGGAGWYLFFGKHLINNPGFSGLLSQVQASPSPLMAILGWGFLLPLIIIALFSKTENEEIIFLKIWFVIGWLIIYLPFGFQKLLIRGLFIPAVSLAVIGLKKVSERFYYDFRVISLFLIFLTSFSTFFITFKRLKESSDNRWIYLTQEEGEIINYLKSHGRDEEGVLASYRLANIIPANTSKRVWAGHAFQTPEFEKRIWQVNRFFAGKMEEIEAKLFLEKTKTVWVLWGPDEKAIGDLTTLPYDFLQPVIEKKQVILYRLKKL